MLVELAVRPVLLWICFSGLTNGNWGRTALSQLFSLQWCRKPLSSSWQSHSLVCPRHCLESAGCCPSYGPRSLELRRLCWMPTDSSIWAPARIQRGMDLPNRIYFSFPSPILFLLLGMGYGQEENWELPCFMPSWNVRLLSEYPSLPAGPTAELLLLVCHRAHVQEIHAAKLCETLRSRCWEFLEVKLLSGTNVYCSYKFHFCTKHCLNRLGRVPIW